jgi:hypothetical protein
MSNKGQFPKGRFLAKAHAVALGGRIDSIRLHGKERSRVGASFVVEGGSCSLSTEGGRSLSRAKGRATIVAGRRIVHFDSAEAEAWEEFREEGDAVRCVTFTRAAIRGLEIGGDGKMPRLRLEYGEMAVKSEHMNGEARFTLEILRLVNLTLDGKNIAPTLRDLDESPLRKQSLAGIVKGLSDPQQKKHAQEKGHRLLLDRSDPKTQGCGAQEGWRYHDDFGFVRVATFDVTPDTYLATLLDFRLGCDVEGGGTAVQLSGNGTIDPH